MTLVGAAAASLPESPAGQTTSWEITGWPLWMVLLPAIGVPVFIAAIILVVWHYAGPPPINDLAAIFAYSLVPVFVAIYFPVKKYLGGPRRVGFDSQGVTLVFPHRQERVPWDRMDAPSYSAPYNPRAPQLYPWVLNYRDATGRKRFVNMIPVALAQRIVLDPNAPDWAREATLRKMLGIES